MFALPPRWVKTLRWRRRSTRLTHLGRPAIRRPAETSDPPGCAESCTLALGRTRCERSHRADSIRPVGLAKRRMFGGLAFLLDGRMFGRGRPAATAPGQDGASGY